MQQVRLSRRACLKWLVAGAASTLLAACARSQGGLQGVAATPALQPVHAASGKGVRITLSHPSWSASYAWSGSGVHWREILTALAVRDPAWPADLDLVTEEIDADRYEFTLQERHAAGVAPDLCLEYDLAIYDAARRGRLLELDSPIAADSELIVGDFYARQLAAARYGGRLYALPLRVTCGVLCINRDLFRTSGARVPAGEWRWDDLREVAIKLTQAEVRHWGFGCIRWHSLLERVWQNGGEVFDESRTRCLLAAPAAIEAMQYWQDLARQEQVSPGAEGALNWADQVARFQAGELAMIETSTDELASWNIGQVRFGWSLVGLPYQKRRMNGAYTTYLAAGAQTKHAPEAWRAIRELLSRERLSRLAQMLCVPVGRRSVNALMPFAIPDAPADWDLVLSGIQEGRPLDGVANAHEVYGLISQMCRRAMDGQGSAAGGLAAEYVPRVNAALMA
jgi:ABC-type glycerol-3-phosphate transport system substrate-binding protein